MISVTRVLHHFALLFMVIGDLVLHARKFDTCVIMLNSTVQQNRPPYPMLSVQDWLKICNLHW